MITVHAYEDADGHVWRLLANNENDVAYIENLTDALGWDLLHTYPIEDAARFK